MSHDLKQQVREKHTPFILARLQLIEIEHYENIDILPNTYYYNPNLDVLYQRYTNGYDYIRTLKQSQRYALKTEDGIHEVLVPKKYLRNY